jgi:predicted Fe-Mo cluster-binding NifX family protein
MSSPLTDPAPARFRVAVASSDGHYVHLHFGRATEFQIFDVEGPRHTFVERRPFPGLCLGGEHRLGDLLRVITLLRDCQAVLATRIGPQVSQALARRGIHPFAIPASIPSALKQIRATGFPGVVPDALS